MQSSRRRSRPLNHDVEAQLVLPNSLKHPYIGRDNNTMSATRRQALDVAHIVLAVNSTFDGSPRMAATKGKKEICISHWTPFVACNPGQDAQQYTGYMVRTQQSGTVMNGSVVVCK